jgi:uncharacterized protein YdiU (UPF0061 family)
VLREYIVSEAMAALGIPTTRPLTVVTTGEAVSRETPLPGAVLTRMAANAADFTLTFHYLAEAAVNVAADDTVRRLFKDPVAFDSWAVKWRERLSLEGGTQRCEAMRRVNPKYIPRNHRVEQALNAAVQRADWAPFERLLAVLAAPFDEQPENAIYALPPLPEEVVQQTFCGT